MEDGGYQNNLAINFSSGCFAATVRASAAPSNRGIAALPSDDVCSHGSLMVLVIWCLVFCFWFPISRVSRCAFLLLPQDLANQIRWSRDYRLACERSHKQPAHGKFLCAEAGEWFSGLPRGWTSPVPGSVDPTAFDLQFPDAKTAGSPVSQQVCSSSHSEFSWLGVGTRLLCQVKGKLPVISLFAGCGALELGLSKPWSQQAFLLQRLISCSVSLHHASSSLEFESFILVSLSRRAFKAGTATGTVTTDRSRHCRK